MIRVVVSDLDGTLLKPDHSVGAFTQSVLHDLIQQGVALGLATGRPWGDVVGIKAKMGLSPFLITSNGARVHNAADACIFRKDIQPAIVSKLVHYPAPAGSLLNVYHDDAWLVTEPNPSLLGDYQQSGFRYTVVSPEAIPTTGIAKLFWIGEHDILKVFKQELLGVFGDEVSIMFSAPNYLEVMAAGVSKGAALGSILQHLGRSAHEALAFGDGENDLDMLTTAGKGIVMSNASDTVKAALPHLERIGECKDEAVAHYLKQYVLNGSST